MPAEPCLLDTLTAALLDDPLYRWLYPDPSLRPVALRQNLRLTLELVVDVGRVETTADGAGVALWTAPGVELLDDPAPFVALLERWAPDRLEAALAGMAACSGHRDPSAAVLHLLAVHPARQGRRVGERLLAPTLQRCDRAGTPVALESSNPRNLRFYRRAGFLALAGVAVPGGGPVMWPMRRLPGGGPPERDERRGQAVPGRRREGGGTGVAHPRSVGAGVRDDVGEVPGSGQEQR